MKKKPGRPHKNIYDAQRLQRAYRYISSTAGISDAKISLRMSLVLSKLFDRNADVDSLRAWTSQIRRGSKASISAEHLWSLIYVSNPEFNDRFIKGVVKGKETYLVLQSRHANYIMTALHYIHTPNFGFFDRFIKGKEKTFLRRGNAIYSVLFDAGSKWVYPLFDFFDCEDIAIDVAEITGMDFLKSLNVVKEVYKIFEESINADKYYEASKIVTNALLTETSLSAYIIDDIINRILQILIIVKTHTNPRRNTYRVP